ncbi:MAG: ribulokinase, partial [Caldilineaceae bacterium]|nr:ribulokinase [Caldilineaceae bacterium]
MHEPRYAVGVDFGTESGRALLVDVNTGEEVAAAVHPYANGVIDEKLPGSDVRLELDWALQDPNDYLEVFKHAIPATLKQSGVDPADVIGIGIDFTACTMLPTKADGTPLCFLPEWRNRPHAWVKLWKHHAAQPEANWLNATARRLGCDFLDRYGGKVSSEWFVPKVMQIVDEDPDVYAAADRLIEAADWVIWQLAGQETRNLTAAGYKGLWSKRSGFPPSEFFQALDPRLENLVDEKMSRRIFELGQRAGGLTEKAAAWTGLRPGTAVAVANVDAHVAVPAAGVVEPARMVIIMGTSNCHMLMGTQERTVPGICGYVQDGIIPGMVGYEAGQSCVGDHFAWFVENCVPGAYEREAAACGISLHELLEAKAAQLAPGASGLVALDWWNGNRSVLVDVDLTGMIVGMTLATRPEEIYRALIEATAYGTRMIVETFAAHDVPVDEIVATGGL